MAERRKKDSYKPLASEDPVVGSVFMDQVLDRFNINLDKPENQVIIHWSSIVGKETAEHARCEKIEKGVLYVACDHPSRAARIRLESREILKNISGVFPEINLSKIVTYIHK